MIRVPVSRTLATRIPRCSPPVPRSIAHRRIARGVQRAQRGRISASFLLRGGPRRARGGGGGKTARGAPGKGETTEGTAERALRDEIAPCLPNFSHLSSKTFLAGPASVPFFNALFASSSCSARTRTNVREDPHCPVSSQVNSPTSISIDRSPQSFPVRRRSSAVQPLGRRIGRVRFSLSRVSPDATHFDRLQFARDTRGCLPRNNTDTRCVKVIRTAANSLPRPPPSRP